MENTIRDYSGRWSLPDSEESFDGVLRYDDDTRSVLLELAKLCGEDGLGERILDSRSPRTILGELSTGSAVTLLDCQRIHSHVNIGNHITELFRVEYVLFGQPDNSLTSSTASFVGGVVDYGEVNEWMGLCSYEWNLPSLDSPASINWSHSELNEIAMSSGLQLSLIPTMGAIPFRSYQSKIDIEQHVGVYFAYDSPVAWQSMMSDFVWLGRLIELGKGSAVDLEDVKYLHASYQRPEHPDLVGVHRFEPIQVFLGTGRGRLTETKERWHEYIFDLSEVVGASVFQKWFELHDRLEPVVELYSLAYSSRMPSATALFLNLMQALETFHARFICNNANEYRERVDHLVDCCAEDGERLRSFLCDHGQSCAKKIYLKSRLSDLLYAEGLRPVKPRFFDSDLYPQQLADTRNYYTHYDPKKRDDAIPNEQLPVVNAELMALCEYHLMVILGFEPEFACERVKRKLGNLVGW